MKQNLKLISYKDLEELGFGTRCTIWRKIKSKTFPPPFEIGNGKKVWLEKDINEWIENKKIDYQIGY